MLLEQSMGLYAGRPGGLGFREVIRFRVGLSLGGGGSWSFRFAGYGVWRLGSQGFWGV